MGKQMNLTKKQLKRIIREELNLLKEQEQEQTPPKERTNVRRVSKKLDKVAGLDDLLSGLKNRQDLVQFIWGQVLQKVAGNISKQDIGAALKVLLAQVGKSER
jgi:hypothetical protein